MQNPTSGSTLYGVLVLFVSAILFGSYVVWTKLLGDAFESFFQAWTRGVLVLIISLPILILTKQLRPIERRDWKWFAVYTITGSLVAAPFFYSVNTIGIGPSSLIFYSSALLASFIIGGIFFQEKLTKIKVVSILLTIAGLLCIFSLSVESLSILGMVLAMFGGANAASAVSFSKKVSMRYSALMLITTLWFVMILYNLPMSLLFGETQVMPSLTMPWLYQVMYAFVVIGAGTTVMIGLRYVEAGVGGVIRTSQVVFGIAFGVVIFSEAITMPVLIGGTVIVLAGMLPHISKIMQTQKKGGT